MWTYRQWQTVRLLHSCAYFSSKAVVNEGYELAAAAQFQQSQAKSTLLIQRQTKGRRGQTTLHIQYT